MTRLDSTKSKKIALAMAVLVLVTGLGWAGAYWWANQAAARALLAVEQAAAESVSKSEVITFTKMLDRTAARRQLIGQYFINSETVVNLLSDLDQYGQSSGVAVEVIEVAEDKELFLTIKAEGSFRAVNRFIGLVELAPYGLKISELKFNYGVPTVDGRQSPGASWTVTLNLVVASFNAQP